jgi:hypothetical protein
MAFANAKLMLGTLATAALALVAQPAIAQTNIDATPFDDDNTTGANETHGGTEQMEPAHYGDSGRVPTATPFDDDSIPGDQEGRVYETDTLEPNDVTVPSATPFEDESVPASEEGREFESPDQSGNYDPSDDRIPEETRYYDQSVPYEAGS